MNKHTPGPWIVNHESYDVCDHKLSVEAKDEYFIAQVDEGIQQEANARLIAAAPDLLAALEIILPAIERDDLRTIILAAIAKATDEY